MTSAQMYELARAAVAEAADVPEAEVSVLWVGGIMEDRRAVAWCGGKLYMVHHDAVGEQTTVDAYVKEV